MQEQAQQEEQFMDWGDVAAKAGDWIEVKVLMRNVAAQATAGTVGVDEVNEELAGLRSRGWDFRHISVIRSTENTFALVVVMEKNLGPG